jgi:arylsulfatase A-like enzyme
MVLSQQRRLLVTVLVVLAMGIATAFTSSPSVAGGTAAALAGSDPRPNIVFITTDDMRVGDLWAMPNVRQLLTQQGTTFTNSYASFPLCCPARASWVTGQYGHNHGVMGNQSPDFPEGGYAALDASSTIATWLKNAGYQTAFVGKYLNYYGMVKPVTVPPGWQEWHASVGGGNYFFTRLRETNGTSTLATHTYDGTYQVDLYDKLATDIIKRRVPSDVPLFLWVSQYAPHGGTPTEADDPPILTPAVPPRYRNYFAGESLRTDPSYNEADVSDKPSFIRSRNRLTTAMQAMLKESYQQRLESLKAVDDSVGHIVSTLAATGELDNTVVAFSSDNGYMMGEHRLHAGKSVAYEPSSRVPLIMRGPGFPAGRSRAAWVANVDVAPTFADLANTTPGLKVDGRSLLPLAVDPAGWAHRTLVFEAGPKSIGGTDRYHGIRDGSYKYVEHSTGEVEMYNLATDPYELVNLIGDPSYNSKQAALHERLQRMEYCAGLLCR